MPVLDFKKIWCSMITNIQERRDRIIETIVKSFLDTGEPVCSTVVSAECSLGLSPASIRSIMKELEEDGYLSQPHTSAGRIPTVKCYRYYVRCLMKEIDLSDSELQAVRNVAKNSMLMHDFELFMSHMASVLSEVTDLIGVALSPSFEQGIVDRIEIVNLSGSRFLLIISLKSGIVNTIHITLDKVIPKWKIDETAQLLTHRLHGLTVSEVKKSIGHRLKGVDAGDRGLVEIILRGSETIFSFSEDNSIHVAGLTRVLTYPEFEPFDSSLKLIDMFEHKDEILKVLKTTVLNQDVVSFHIGGTGPWGSYPPLSLVSAMYHSENATGAIGVIGPSRVYYPKVSAIVRYAAIITSHFFSS